MSTHLRLSFSLSLPVSISLSISLCSVFLIFCRCLGGVVVWFACREKGRSARVEVAAGDFGMATLLFQETKIRGTLPFMAPEMEKPKDKDSQKKLVLLASPAFDTYALGFTLSALWTAGTEYTERYSWVAQCIRPSMVSAGQAFTFQQFSSREGAPVFDKRVKESLARCMQDGGKVDKLYHADMPLLIRLKIQQMTDTDPQARVSLRHIRFFFKSKSWQPPFRKAHASRPVVVFTGVGAYTHRYFLLVDLSGGLCTGCRGV